MELEEAKTVYRQSTIKDGEGLSCFEITPKIIDGRQLSSRQQDLVNILMEGIKSGESAGIIFYRGMDGVYLNDAIRTNTYKPFISASRNISEAIRFAIGEDPILLKIIKPESIHYLEMCPVGVCSLENQEVLFQMGLKVTISDLEDGDLSKEELFNINVFGSSITIKKMSFL